MEVMMRSRAERRHHFERLAREGMQRHKEKGFVFADDPDHIKRDRFRKKWCGCWMCARVRDNEGPTIQELRVLQERIDA